MLALGTLALLQMLVIPGGIVLTLTRPGGSLLQRAAYLVALSLIANYALVFSLSALGLFRLPVMLAVVGAELLWLAWRHAGGLSASMSDWVAGIRRRLSNGIEGLGALFAKEERSEMQAALYRALVLASLALALLGCAWIGYRFLRNMGTVFDGWDAVVSWNIWAREWATGRIPASTRYYPQLVPTNWSLTYVLTGNAQVQFFAKLAMPLFPLLTVLLMFDLGLARHRLGSLLGMALTVLLVRGLLSEEVSNGYVDHAVAFFGFLAVYCLLRAEQGSAGQGLGRTLGLGAIFAGGAGVTKEAGLYVLAVYPLLAWLIVLRRAEPRARRMAGRALLISLGVAILLVAPWYLLKLGAFASGQDSSQLGWLVEFTRSRYASPGGLFQLRQALESWGAYLWVLGLAVVSLAVVPPAFRWITVLIVLPYTLLWVYVASYDFRNLAIAVPFIGLTAGLGVEWLLLKAVGLGLWDRIGRWPVAALVGLVALILTLAAVAWPGDALRARQDSLQRQLFSPRMNAQLYALIEAQGPEVRILTNYPVRYLPDLQDNQVPFGFGNTQEFLALMESPYFQYLLVPGYAEQEIHTYLEKGLAEGSLRLLFEDDQWIHYTLIEIVP